MITFHCDHGSKHAWLSIDKTSGLSVYAGPCDCGGNPAACRLLQVTCVDCRHMDRARDAARRPLGGRVVEQHERWTLAHEYVGEPELKGRHKGSRIRMTMVTGYLGELNLIERAAGQALLDAEEGAPEFAHLVLPGPTEPCIVALCGRAWLTREDTNPDSLRCPDCQRVVEDLAVQQGDQGRAGQPSGSQP